MKEIKDGILQNKMLLFIIIIGGFLRVYGLNWDQGHFLHPDERLYVLSSNISLPKTIQEFFSPNSPLNPHMFYYGPFPLYLYKIGSLYLLPFLSFLIASRLISSLFSILTIPLLFLIGKQLFSSRLGRYAAFIFSFSVGSIQYAHFNTTESILVFLLTIITFLSIQLVMKKNYYLLIPLGILTALSYATKIIGITFILFPLLSLALIFKKDEIRKNIVWVIIFISILFIVGFFIAPYQIIDNASFIKEQNYMQNVTYGKEKPPFVIIYENTLGYIYPLVNILPFTFGFFSLPIALLGLFLFIKKYFLRDRKKMLYLFILIYPIFYFLWTGNWYAKFARYYILLFPFMSIWTAVALEKIRHYKRYILLTLIAINGILFVKIYTTPNTRIQASDWIYKSVPQKKIIIGEHWDDNLPLTIDMKSPSSYTTLQLGVYESDTEKKINDLANILNQGDYLILSSRRVYYSIMRNSRIYPLTSKFYNLLFEEKLGYILVKKFTNYPFFTSDDFADESFQSYDHPPVYVFKNEKKLSESLLKEIITHDAKM